MRSLVMWLWGYTTERHIYIRQGVHLSMSGKEILVRSLVMWLVEASTTERHIHTRQDVHLNTSGKKWLADFISRAVDRLNTTTSGNQSAVSEQLSVSFTDFRQFSTSGSMIILTKNRWNQCREVVSNLSIKLGFDS